MRPDRRGIVIAEGSNVVERLARSPYPMRAVVGVAGPHRRAARRCSSRSTCRCTRVDKWLLSDVVGFRVTRGVLASADRPAPRAVDDVLAGARRVAVLEALNDFENLGALFRNAAAFGVDAVLLDQRCADPLYRRSVRVSMGHVLQVPFAVLRRPVARGAATSCAAHGFDRAGRHPGRRRRRALRDVVTPPALGRAVRRRGPGAERRPRWPRPTCASASRWPTASTRSTWPPRPRWCSPSST